MTAPHAAGAGGVAGPTGRPRPVLVVSDNPALARHVERLVMGVEGAVFDLVCSPAGSSVMGDLGWQPLDVRADIEAVLARYDLVLSMHCKQFFPAPLVQGVHCVNLHPGLNPYNRGWYPQVFSILNGLPLGATLHVMDEELDHGPIIAQEHVEVLPTDTSLDAYERVQAAEVRLLEAWLPRLVAGDYEAEPMQQEGNVNLKADFERLCRIDLAEQTTFGDAIDRLRALTHGEHRNAYFVDDSGRRVHLRLLLERADS